MNKIVSFPTAQSVEDVEDMQLVISDHSDPEFVRTAHEVSDHIKSLPLTHAQNDTLIALIIENLRAGEKTAFYKGVDIGMRYALEAERS